MDRTELKTLVKEIEKEALQNIGVLTNGNYNINTFEVLIEEEQYEINVDIDVRVEEDTDYFSIFYSVDCSDLLVNIISDYEYTENLSLKELEEKILYLHDNYNSKEKQEEIKNIFTKYIRNL